MASASKRKKCKVCKTLFFPRSSFANICSPKCAIVMVKDKRAMVDQRKHAGKVRDAEERKMRSEFQNNDRAYMGDFAQKIFNAYIRKRDAQEGCISCDGWTAGNSFHCGHFRSRGSASQHRFSEDNCNKQCAQCNTMKSGNISEYRLRLIKKIGLERVEALENDNQVRRWTLEEYHEIVDTYKQKMRDLDPVLS